MNSNKTTLIACIVVSLVVGFMAGRIRITREESPRPKETAEVKPAEAPVPETPDSSRPGPKPIRTVMPEYPQTAKEKGIHGTVFLKALVDTAGSVTEAEVIGSVHPELDSAAVQAIRGWKFSPASVADKPVTQYVCIPVKFVLEDDQPASR